MVGGRGCVEAIPGADEEYLITVAWQGLTPISAPPASVACGRDDYDGEAGSACTGDLCRRTVTTIVRIAKLD
jgi:type IV pilus assembly protein PilV